MSMTFELPPAQFVPVKRQRFQVGDLFIIELVVSLSVDMPPRGWPPPPG
jgi:hypothetical protein